MNSSVNNETELINENYYWVFHNETFHLAKMKQVTNNTLFEYYLCELIYENDQVELIENDIKTFLWLTLCD